MSIEDRAMGARAAERVQRHDQAAARQMAKAASDDDANPQQRRSAFWTAPRVATS
jgi:hypothetical protein